jgi:RHS repeat-associated protein
MKPNSRHWAGITAGILSLAEYASATSLANERYVYDASGNIIEKSIDGKVTRMAYDQANRHIGSKTAGKGKQTTAYDAAGRPVTERNADGKTIRAMRYGYGDKVLEAQTRDFKAQFYYNSEGLLVGKNAEGNVSTYIWDGNVVVADGSEVFVNEAHTSGGVPVLNSGRTVIISDYLGNTLSAGMQQLANTSYGEGVENARFTGKLFIEELRGYIFKYRLYSTESARWTSSDPLGFPDGSNVYLYASNPTDTIDPLGTQNAVLYYNNTAIGAYSYDARNFDNGFGCYIPFQAIELSKAEYDWNFVGASDSRLQGKIYGYGWAFGMQNTTNININPTLDIWVEASTGKIQNNLTGTNDTANGPQKAHMIFDISGEDTAEMTVAVPGKIYLRKATINAGGTAGPANWAQVTANYTFNTEDDYENYNLGEYTWKEN